MIHSQLVGDDLHSPSREFVENVTGSTITKLTCVKYIGMGVNFPEIMPSTPILDVTRGIVISDIADQKIGVICVIGWIHQADTSAWTVGTKLYCGVNGALTTSVTGLPVAMIIKSHATDGVLYVDSQGVTSADIAGAVNAYSWSLHGNDTSLITSPIQIGTTTAQSLPFITDNTQRMIITDLGRVGIGNVTPMAGLHIKFHNDHPQSGRLVDTFTLRTSSTTATNAYSFTLPEFSVATFTITVLARKANGTSKGSLKRTVTYYRDASAGNIQMLKSPQSDYTARDSLFDITYAKTSSTAIFKVKAPDTTDTLWYGTVEIDLITE